MRRDTKTGENKEYPRMGNGGEGNSKIEELALVYNMFSRRDASFELLRNHIRDYIADEGSKLVQDEKLKNEDLVIRLIELRERINDLHLKAMQKDN